MSKVAENIYGLIGYPLDHSFSKKYFTNKFLQEGIINCEYQEFPIEDITEFKTLIPSQPQLRGLNVTIPYKETIIPFLDELSDEAQQIGAVNTIKCLPSSSRIHLIGYNTDAIGFRETLNRQLKQNISQAFILGSGGAAKAVQFVLHQMGIAVHGVSRTPSEGQMGYEKLEEHLGNSSALIVNTTPLGMFPNIDAAPPLPYSQLNETHVLYDLIYNPEETVFLQRGKRQGAQVINGLEMLQLQAEASWKIWNA